MEKSVKQNKSNHLGVKHWCCRTCSQKSSHLCLKSCRISSSTRPCQLSIFEKEKAWCDPYLEIIFEERLCLITLISI